jgi:hypothetical protein
MWMDRGLDLASVNAAEVARRFGCWLAMAAVAVLCGCQRPGPLLEITKQPASVTVQDGERVVFSTAATGGGAFTYQWIRNGKDIPGATAADYAVTLTYADNGASYTCFVVADINRGKYTSAAIATVTPTAVVFVLPDSLNVSVAAGSTVVFSSPVASGSLPRAFQWNRNGLAIADATQPEYTLPSALPADNGAQFNLTVTNPAGAFAGPSFVLTVTP